jgi:tRNA (guanine37-N1)-methyltransferase
VDEGLSGVADTLDDVSVLENQEAGDIDMPSFEVIGDIAVINQLEMPEDEAVDAILSHHDVKTILLKTEPLRGEFRVGEYKTLYGNETGTIHRENGCRFKVDVTEAYFSERQGTERERLSEMVEEGERVLVVGAGVGSFPIVIATLAEPDRVIGVEKNSKAAQMMRENVELNNIGDSVDAWEGDISEFDARGRFDRVVVAAPEHSGELLEHSRKFLEDFGELNLYTFLEDGERPQYEGFEASGMTECGERGPCLKRVRLNLFRQ